MNILVIEDTRNEIIAACLAISEVTGESVARNHRTEMVKSTEGLNTIVISCLEALRLFVDCNKGDTGWKPDVVLMDQNFPHYGGGTEPEERSTEPQPYGVGQMMILAKAFSPKAIAIVTKYRNDKGGHADIGLPVTDYCLFGTVTLKKERAYLVNGVPVHIVSDDGKDCPKPWNQVLQQIVQEYV